MNKPKLLNLPNELFAVIFDRISVTDLVHHIALTCTRFVQLSKVSCTRRTALTLIFGEKNQIGVPFARDKVSSVKGSFLVPQGSFATLRYKEIAVLSRAFLRKIVSTFPNIRSLQLSTDGVSCSQVRQAINETLLHGLGHKLESLHLILYFVMEHELDVRALEDEDKIKEALTGTLTAINHMSKLKRLVFSTQERLHSVNLPILSQLEEFYFNSNDRTREVLGYSLGKYAMSNQKLKRVGFITDTMINDSFVKKVISSKKPFPLSSSITHLSLYNSPDRKLKLTESLLSRLSNLTAISLIWNRTRRLEPMIQLLSKFRLDFLGISVEHAVAGQGPSVLDLTPLVNICQIESIKSFTLFYDAPSHEALNLFHLDRIFPCLKMISIYSGCFACPTCEYNFGDHMLEDEDYVEKRTRCIQLSIEPFRRMASKPTISFCYISKLRQRFISARL